jgi:hypothetical protein
LVLIVFLGNPRKLFVSYRLQERDYDTLWMTEDAGKKTFLWRQVAQRSVAIREKRARAVPGTHVHFPLCMVHLLLPVPVCCRRYEQRHRVRSQSKGGEKR